MFRYYNGGFKTVSQIAYEAFVEADEAKEAVDNLEIGGRNYDELGTLLEKLDILTGDDVQMIFTVSEDNENLPESVLKYLIPQAD